MDRRKSLILHHSSHWCFPCSPPSLFTATAFCILAMKLCAPFCVLSLYNPGPISHLILCLIIFKDFDILRWSDCFFHAEQCWRVLPFALEGVGNFRDSHQPILFLFSPTALPRMLPWLPWMKWQHKSRLALASHIRRMGERSHEADLFKKHLHSQPLTA